MLKGALAGLVGGIVGSGAKALAERIYPPRAAGRPLAQPSLSDGSGEVARSGIHWTFGALAGAAYGAAVELEPGAGAWGGAGFGLALNKMTREAILPKMGLEPSGAAATIRERTRERQSEWVTHVAYGVVTEAVRRLVRKGL